MPRTFAQHLDGEEAGSVLLFVLNASVAEHDLDTHHRLFASPNNVHGHPIG